jgi:hypothetical protein
MDRNFFEISFKISRNKNIIRIIANIFYKKQLG